MLPALKQVNQSSAPAPILRVVSGAGLKMFNCPNQPGHLRLTKTGCAAMFKRAQAENLEYAPQLLPCRECNIGSQHSSIDIRPAAPITCARCEVRPMRLISSLLCPSCHMRQSEFITGKNARGMVPVRYPSLYIFDHDDSLIIIARNANEAKRIAIRMISDTAPGTLVNYGLATPAEANNWWTHIAKPWAAKHRKPQIKFVV